MSGGIVDKEIGNDTSMGSVWGKPNRSFYRFLRSLEETGLPKTIGILGCSDGKFVLPAARKGFLVLAIDIDTTALNGGEVRVGEKKIFNIGLRKRLAIAKLETQVEVVEGSFLEHLPEQKYTGVFTSGSIHYGENSRYSLAEVIGKIQDYVSPKGLLFQEYIHTSEEDNDQSRHFVDKKTMASFFENPEWTVLKHRKKQYIEGPNPRNEREHLIVWGSILARRNF